MDTYRGSFPEEERYGEETDLGEHGQHPGEPPPFLHDYYGVSMPYARSLVKTVENDHVRWLVSLGMMRTMTERMGQRIEEPQNSDSWDVDQLATRSDD